MHFNDFITHEKAVEPKVINVFGAFSGRIKPIDDLLAPLPSHIQLGKVYDISKEKNRFVITKGSFNLLLGPFWFDTQSIRAISNTMKKLDADFLYTDIFESSICIGPLLNTARGTACLNCINTRKLFHKPEILIENLKRIQTAMNSISVFDIENFNLYKIFIQNEMRKIIINGSKNLYGKSILIDLFSYENQFFDVIKAPNCDVCNRKEIVNPL